MDDYSYDYSGLIRREDAIEAIDEVRDLISVNAYCAITERLEQVPSAEVRTQMSSADLISRQTAIDAINALNNGLLYTHMDYVDAVRSVPSAERIGKWIQISPAKIYECSECGQNVMTNDLGCYKFCHGCGAKMKGEQDE